MAGIQGRTKVLFKSLGGVMCSTETGCNCVDQMRREVERVCVRSMWLLKDVYIGVVKGLIRGTQS